MLAQLLARRGVTNPQSVRAFLDPDHYRPAAPFELPDLPEAVERLEQARQRGETVCVWGDFDVDGQTATTLLVSTLQELGITARYYIPQRVESHGVNLPVLQRLVDEGIDLLLTCDTGVTAHQAVDYAHARGVDVIVTDHHDLPPELPPALAVVNPKRLPKDHPLRELPGVGCAYKLAEALYERMGRTGGETRHMDLVALGIVADVAVQTGDTRYLLQRGLRALRSTGRLGLQEMMTLARLNPERLTAEHIGFVLGPRLNALGRLADARTAVELLTTTDAVRARTLASELEGLNAQRRFLCDQVAQGAEAQLASDPALLEEGALVLSNPSWPAGVIGIVAGRLAERYNRPVVLIAAPPGELGRGSARSVEGCNITAAIAAHQEMLVRFGGHPMAGGLAIEPERIPEFRRALSRTVRRMCGEVRARPPLCLDSYIPLAGLSPELVERLERLAPFGPGNPAPVLASRDLALVSHRTMGQGGAHRLLTVQDEVGAMQRVVWWQGASQPLPEGRFDMAYIVRASDYRGEPEVQVEWVDARRVQEPVAVPRFKPRAVEVVDCRQADNPRDLLGRLQGREGLQVWSEAAARADVGGRDRRELEPGGALAIWTTPPGAGELRAVLARVAPQQVYVFAVDPGVDRPRSFLQRLAGLVKRALQADEGRVALATLAAATAQRETVVRAGLEWLAARGQVVLLTEREGRIYLAAGGQTDDAARAAAEARLQELLAETAAYRDYFGRAAVEVLLFLPDN
ncbi:MAG: single-stranded-DNA-specific exonuclease RecJ [Anaerolineae bacterium]|nr:single-stranded-DNA-specific exonuclease RecJ [Anaerolineae bacterium]